MIPTLSGYLEHSPILLRVKMLKSVVGKIVEAFSKASLPFDVKEIVELARSTDWSDPTVIAVSFLVASITLLVSTHITIVLGSPWQTILALHFWRGAR